MLNHKQHYSAARILQLVPSSKKQEVKKPMLNKLVVHQSEAIHLLDYDNIVFVKADGNYCNINVALGENIYCSQLLKQIEARLKLVKFVRVHQSYLVNLDYVSVIGQGCIKLTSGEELPLSRRKRKAVLDLLANN